MKKLKRLIFLPLMLFTLLLSVPITADANQGNGTEGPSSGSTETVIDGVSYTKTGFLIYLCDKNGQPVGNYKPKIIWYKDAPTVDPDSGYVEYIYCNNYAINGMGDRIYINPRLTAIGTPDYDNMLSNIDWNMPVYNDNGGGNGLEIKNWLLSPQNGFDAGVAYMIDKYWGKYARDGYISSYNADDPEDCWYFVVEGLAYSGLYYGDNYTGKRIIASCKQMASFSTALGGGGNVTEGSEGFKFNRYWYKNLPNAMKLEYSWCGVPVPSYNGSGQVPMANIQNEGYAMVMIRPTDLGGKQIVKCYYEGEEHDKSTISSCGESPELGEEGYEVVSWMTSDKPNNSAVVYVTYEDFEEYNKNFKKREDIEDDPNFKFKEDEKIVYVKLVRAEDGPYTVVKSYYNGSSFEKTKVSTTSKTDYNIKDEGSYEVTEWFTTSKKPSPKPTRSTKWDKILSSYNDSTTIDFDWESPEVPKPIEFSPDDGKPKTVYIKYCKIGEDEDDKQEPSSQGLILSNELNYIFPDISARRLGTKDFAKLITLENVLLPADSVIDGIPTQSDIRNALWTKPLYVNVSVSGGAARFKFPYFSSKYSQGDWNALGEIYGVTNRYIVASVPTKQVIGAVDESSIRRYFPSSPYSLNRSAFGYKPTIVKYRSPDYGFVGSLGLTSGDKPAQSWTETSTTGEEIKSTSTLSSTVQYRLYSVEKHEITVTEACDCGLSKYGSGGGYAHTSSCASNEYKDCNCGYTSHSSHSASCTNGDIICGNTERPANLTHSAACNSHAHASNGQGGINGYNIVGGRCQYSGCSYDEGHTHQSTCYGSCNCGYMSSHTATCASHSHKDCDCGLDDYKDASGSYSHKTSGVSNYTGRCLTYWHFKDTDPKYSTEAERTTPAGDATVTNGIELYTPINTSTSTSTENGSLTKSYYSVGASTAQLKIYPEVEMSYYQYKVSSSDVQTYSSYNPDVKKESAYVFGQKQRVWTPNIVHTYTVNRPTATGVTSLPSAISSEEAKELLFNSVYPNVNNEMLSGICPAGGTFNVGVQTNPSLALVSFGLTVNEHGYNQDNSNENVAKAIRDQHDAYIEAMAADLLPELQLLYRVPGSNGGFLGGANPDDGSGYILSVSASGGLGTYGGLIKSATTEQTVELVFRDGSLTAESKKALVDKLQSLYGYSGDATVVLEKSGIEKQLRDMFVSSFESNTTDNWYDEETTALCVTFYVTTIEMGDCMASDKVDFNTLNAASGITGFKDCESAICATFYSGLKSKNGSVNFTGGHVIKPFSPALGYYFQPVLVDGAYFLVTNKTTSDARN